MTRDYRDWLDDIIHSIDETRDFTHGYVYEEFCVDQKTINAVIRSLEVLGEASKRIPQEIRDMTPDIP